MPTNPTPGAQAPADLEAIAARANAATEGPWKVYEHLNPWTDVAEHSRQIVERLIGTEWHHPQLKDAVGVVGMWHSHLTSRAAYIGIEQADADFIAHARTDIPALLVRAEADAARVAELERLVGYGHTATDFRTLRNVQEQKNKVVDAALALFDDPESSSELQNCVRELRRITAPFSTAEASRE